VRPLFSAIFLFLLCVLLTAVPIVRADTLPYSTRVHSYSGWNTSVSGDVRTVGMSGATIGLPDTFLAASSNPSGLAELLKDADDNIISNNIKDKNIQSTDSPVQTSSLGVAVSIYPWGASIGYVTPSREGGPYYLSNSLDYGNVTVTTRELRLAVARVFAEGKFSLGASINIGQAEEEMQILTGNTGDSVEHTYAVGGTVGGIYRFPHHWLLGMSFFTPMTYNFANNAQTTPPVNSFFQQVVTPARVGLGVGWIPNFYTRMDFSIIGVGSTPGAALLKDDQSLVGQHSTLQPRMGIAYIFSDYPNFRGTLFAGTYYEMTRVENTSNRLHGTSGIEIKPWLFTLGLGGDLSSGYSNVITSVGVDLIKGLMKLGIIPKPYNPTYKGFFPSPTRIRDDGLPRPMVVNWHPEGPDMNPIKIIEKIPEKVSEKIKSLEKPKPPVEPQQQKKPRHTREHAKKRKPRHRHPTPGPTPTSTIQ
jgi:hypothetical protein